MSEKLIADATVKTAQTTETAVKSLIKKAWSIMDAASEKKPLSQLLTNRAVSSIRGES